MNRTSLLSRSALGLALSLGALGAAATIAAPAQAAEKAKPAAAPKVTLSKEFRASVAPLSAALEAAKTKPDVVAAKARVDAATTAYNSAQGAAAKAAAKTARDTAIAALGATLSAERGMLDGSFAAIKDPGDRYTAGQMAVNLGGLSLDSTLQRRGLAAMIESGLVPAADQPRLNFFIGSIAYDAKDYAAARTALGAAVNAGFHENDADALLADAYIQDNQVPQGIQMLKQAITTAQTAGKPAPANWFRRGLGVAYKSKLLDDAGYFSAGLVEAYPTKENWAGAITVLREIARFPAQEELDLMRLMGRTSSYAEERDYVEHIQAADPRRLPGEALKVIDAGVAAGKLKSSDVFVSESRSVASGRLSADKASLASLERDARAANATAATATAGGDAFLSYGEAAKARELYTLALAKPGVDQARVLTRLGIAQVDLGQYAEAQATFAKVEGPRKPLARLWAIYAGGKAKPAA